MNEEAKKKLADRVNRAEFAALTKAAKGTRTSQQFAEQCGVNTSTITRILNMNNTGPSRLPLLRAIAENAAPGSGVTYEALLRANGYADRNVLVEDVRMSGYEDKIQSALFNELLARGAEVRLKKGRYYISSGISLYPDISVRTDATGKKDGVWLFEVLYPYTTNPVHEFNANAEIPRENMHRLSSKVMNIISAFLLASMNLPEQSPATRFSIVTAEPAVYSWMVAEFKNTCVSIDLSIILVNLPENKVADEYVLPRSGGKTVDSYFLTIKALEDNEVEDKINITDMEDIQ